MGGQIQQNGGLPHHQVCWQKITFKFQFPHHQGQDTKPRQVTSVQVRKPFPFKMCSLCIETLYFQRSLPAYARVKQSRVPNAYDKTALRLEVINVSQLPQHHFIPPSIVPAGDDDPPLLSSDLILLTTTTIPTTTSINEDQKQNIGRQCLISAHPRLVTLSRWPRCQ